MAKIMAQLAPKFSQVLEIVRGFEREEQLLIADHIRDMAQQAEKDDQARAERVASFRKSARAIGEAVAEKQLSEDEINVIIEEAREEVFREHYGDLT